MRHIDFSMTGKDLKRLRQQRGLSLSKFAKIVGVAKSTVARWQQENELRPVILAAIEKALKR